MPDTITMMAQLRALAEQYPDTAKELFEEMPEARAALEELSARYSVADLVTVDGFKIFYKEIYNRECPRIAEPIISAFVDAFHNKTGVMEECWRGFGKSTLLIAWAAYIVGTRPVGSTALIRINDTKAKEAGETIAEIIETNPGWKKIFSHVVPDKESGWSVERGYHVKDMRVCKTNETTGNTDYDKWLQMCFADHVSEPSLACGGVTSGIIIGMHPSNGMWFDDLHNEGNTRSLAEMQKIVDTVSADIIPTWTGAGGSPALGVACTPWSEDDAYVRMMKTGLFEKVSIPLFVREGQIPQNHPATKIWEENYERHGAELFEPYNQRVILTWPEIFPLEMVLKMHDSHGARFGQMCLLDLTTLKGLTLQRQWLGEYPHEQIGESWPTYFGIDFASTTDKSRFGKTDYFALAVGKGIPSGGIVSTCGFVDRLPMHESIAKVQALASLHKPVAIGVEKHGSGKQFIEQMTYATKLPVIPLPLEGARVTSKGERFERFLASDFSTGKMWLSSVQDLFLKKFIDEWISWDGGLARSRTGHDDTLDAMYWLREVALGNVIKMRNPGVDNSYEEERELSPFANAGAHYRR